MVAQHPSNQEELRELKESCVHLQSAFNALLRVIQRLENVSARPDPQSRLPRRPDAPPRQPRRTFQPPRPDAVPKQPASDDPGRSRSTAPLASKSPRTLVRRPSNQSVVEFLIGDTWMRRAGFLTLLLGVLFLVLHAYDEGWMTPAVLVALCGIVGLCSLAAGEVLVVLSSRTAAAFAAGLGAAITSFAIGWGQSAHGLFSPAVALASQGVLTILIAGIAAHGRLVTLTLIAAVCAAASPLGLAHSEGLSLPLVLYAAATQGLILLIGHLRRWNTPRVVCWLCLAALTSTAELAHPSPEASNQLMLAALAFTYLLFQGEALFTARRDEDLAPWPLCTVIHINNIGSLIAVSHLARGIGPTPLMIGCLLASFMQWCLAGRIHGLDVSTRMIRRALRLDGAIFLAFLAPLQLDGYTVTLTWCAQALVTAWICRRFFGPWPAAYAGGIAIAAMAHVALVDLFDPTLTAGWTLLGFFEFTFVTLLALLTTLVTLIVASFLLIGRTIGPWDRRIGVVLCALANVMLLGIAANQATDVYATWWWIGLALVWIIASLRTGLAAVGVLCLTGLCVLKFYFVDTIPMIFEEEAPDVGGPFINRIVITGAILSLLLGVAGVVIRRMPTPWARRMNLPAWRTALAIVAPLTITWTGTFEIVRIYLFEDILSHLPDPTLALHAGMSIFWAVAATLALISGLISSLRMLRYFAMGLFGLTLAKVLVLDLAYLETAYRIVLFIALGGLMLLASLLYHRLSARVLDATPST